MKKTMKLISIVSIAIIIAMSIATISNAGQLDPSVVKPNYEGIETDNVVSVAGKVLGLIRNIAIIAGVVLVAILGVKYMMGSVEEKAEYKKSFVPLIVGAIVVMSATQIATMIFSVSSN